MTNIVMTLSFNNFNKYKLLNKYKLRNNIKSNNNYII